MDRYPPDMPDFDTFSAWRGVLPGRSGAEQARYDARWAEYRAKMKAWTADMCRPQPTILSTLRDLLRGFV